MSAATKFGDRAFAISDPLMWNSLPTTVRNSSTLSNFKSSLKSHLFLDYSQGCTNSYDLWRRPWIGFTCYGAIEIIVVLLLLVVVVVRVLLKLHNTVNHSVVYSFDLFIRKLATANRWRGFTGRDGFWPLSSLATLQNLIEHWALTLELENEACPLEIGLPSPHMGHYGEFWSPEKLGPRVPPFEFIYGHRTLHVDRVPITMGISHTVLKMAISVANKKISYPMFNATNEGLTVGILQIRLAKQS